MTFNSFCKDLFRLSGPAYGAGPAGFKRLLARLGNPQNHYQTVHIAGTNGKGSVCYLLARSLEADGRRTGLFLSPHLCSPTERISINGRLISKSDFVKTCQTVLAAQKEKLNFFEIITAAAFLYFSYKKIEIAVLETGLGGKKDPTNACFPKACVITSVGKDHCHLLGDSLTQIAREKAGIIKSGVPVVCPLLPTEALSEVKKAACAAKAPLHIVQPTDPFVLKSIDWKHGYLRLQKGRYVWKLNSLGEKQTQNACLVYQTGHLLGVRETALRKGFSSGKIPGRFEVLSGGKHIFVLDGAHNPPATQAFVDFFTRSPWSQKAVLVCGFMQDKDFPAMLRLLAPHFKALYITQPKHSRAAALSDVRSVLPQGSQAFFFPSPIRALKAAAKTSQIVAVTGSFYVVGALHFYLTRAFGRNKD